MITYRYSLLEDLRWSWRTLKKLKWLNAHNLKIFYPNPLKIVALWFVRPRTAFQTEKNITCFWIHAGTWGAYTPPDKIFICPWQIERAGGLEQVIRHEITHLEHEAEVKNMSHEEKEDYIESKIKQS